MSDSRIERLLLVTSDYHYRVDGRVETTSAFMRFVPELLVFAKSIEICAPVHEGVEHAGFSIESPEITYRPLPPSRTLEQFLRRLPADVDNILGQLYEGTRAADLVWINGPHPLLPLAALVARLCARPYLLWLRGDILETVRSKYTGRGWRSKLALRTAYYLDGSIRLFARSGAVFYTGSGLRRYTEGAPYSQSANTSLVSDAQLAPRAHSRLHSPARLLWAGQLRPVKGVRFLLRAIRLLLDDGQKVRLTLLGAGEDREALESQIERLELRDVVSLEGYVAPGPELDAYFREADIFVLPSLSEGVPKVLFEAMAHALPVVATDVGGVHDVVTHESNGLLVRPSDASELAATIRRLCADGALRARISCAALDFARDHTAEAEAGRIRAGIRLAFPHLWSSE